MCRRIYKNLYSEVHVASWYCQTYMRSDTWSPGATKPTSGMTRGLLILENVHPERYAHAHAHPVQSSRPNAGGAKAMESPSTNPQVLAMAFLLENLAFLPQSVRGETPPWQFPSNGVHNPAEQLCSGTYIKYVTIYTKPVYHYLYNPTLALVTLMRALCHALACQA